MNIANPVKKLSSLQILHPDNTDDEELIEEIIIETGICKVPIPYFLYPQYQFAGISRSHHDRDIALWQPVFLIFINQHNRSIMLTQSLPMIIFDNSDIPPNRLRPKEMKSNCHKCFSIY